MRAGVPTHHFAAPVCAWLHRAASLSACCQAREHILNLVGLSAPPELLQKLTYLAFYHDQRVHQIDTVR